MTTSTQVKLGQISIDRQTSTETVRLYVHYTYNGEEKVDNGEYAIAENIYRPSLDQEDEDGNYIEEAEAEYEALRDAVEAR